MMWRLRIENTTLWMIVGIFASFPVFLGLANALMLAVLVGWLLSGNYHKLGQGLLASPVACSLVALYVVVVLGTLWGDVPLADRYLHVAKYAKLLFAALLIGALHERIWQRRGLLAFCAAMFFVMTCTWLNVWFVLPWSVTKTPGWGLSHHVIGDYITQNIMMAYFVVVLLAALWLQLKEPMHFKKRATIAMIAILIVLASVSITHLSIGRTGYVLLVLACLLTALVLLRGKQLWIAGALIVLLGGTAALSSQPIRERVVKAYTEVLDADTQRDSSLGIRTLIYTTAPKVFADSPWIGHGTGSYHTLICRYIEPKSICPSLKWHPENQYVAFALAQGGMGLVMYLVVFASALALAYRSSDPISRLLLCAITIFLMAGSLVNTSLFSSRESHFYLMMLALASAIAHRSLARSDSSQVVFHPR